MVKQLALAFMTVAAFGLVTLLGVFVNSSPAGAQSSTAGAQGAMGTAPVTIVSPLPLPVAVNGNIAGSVAATQSGTWNVGVDGTVAVKNVNEPGREPYGMASTSAPPPAASTART